jgi:hypothetical protein
MRSRSGIIQAELQNVCPLADSCTHLCREPPNTFESVYPTMSGAPCQTKREHEEKQPHGGSRWIASMRAVMNPLHAVPENRLAIAQPRLINGRCGSLLLQPRVISRRRRHGRRRGACRQQRSPAAEAHERGNGKTCVKSFHVVSPGSVAGQLRTAVWSKFGLDRRHFKACARPCDFTFGSGLASALASPCPPLRRS